MHALRFLLLFCFSWLAIGTALAEDTGTLSVVAGVTGAKVWVDYEEVGETPLDLALPAGKHSVRVAYTGFDPWFRQVTVTAGDSQEVKATLSPGGNTVEFYTEPMGAKVLINGKDAGVAPTRLSDIPTGRYEYRIEKTGFEPEEGSFELMRGDNVLVVGRLVTSQGRFEIESSPEGALVYLDGAEVGKTPLVLEGIAPGVHKVGLVKPGYALVVREVDTSDGSKGEVNARLKDSGAELVIKTGSANASVFLDEVPVGEGKSVQVTAARGDITLKVVDGGQSFEESVEVAPSGKQLFVVDLGEGSVKELKPLVKRPVFWAATGGGAAAVGAGIVVAIIATRPEPDPEGDVVLPMP